MKTKLAYLFLGLFLFSVQADAQHVVRFSPLALAKSKAKVHYEYGGLNKIGLGVIASGFFGLYPGVRVEPYFRYYITDEALQGFYVQPKLHFSANSFTYSVTSGGVTEDIKNSFNEWGASGTIGWQFLLGGNENIVVDIFTGYRYSSLDGTGEETLEEDGADDAASEGLYKLLHSNTFDLGLSVGFKF